MRSIEEIGEWWPSFEATASSSEVQISASAVSATNLITEKGRSAYWKSFLLFNEIDTSKWPEKLDKTRQAFRELRGKFVDPLERPLESDTLIDPLSDNANSPWNHLRKDELIRQEINQDVERCLPDDPYFRHPLVQAMLLDVLFVWTKLNPDIGYRQGMHELLAPILWTVDKDSVDPQSIPSSNATTDKTLMIMNIFDASYVTHDTFALFTKVMQQTKSSYELHDPLAPTLGDQQVGPANSHDAAITSRSQIIFTELLAQSDPGLSAHLTEIGVIPQIFLIRWIRLLFAREFPFDSLLNLWDNIFAEGITPLCVDLVCVAMLLRIRQQLLNSDNSQALQLLLHYPNTPEDSDPSTLVEEAQLLKNKIRLAAGNSSVSANPAEHPVALEAMPLSNTIEAESTPRSKNRSNIESILNDAARNIASRGERWGVYQTVRDVAGEVRKNVATIQAKTHSRIQSRDFTGLRGQKKSESDLLQRINELDARNKSLAKMLEGAVADLWQQQKETSKEKRIDDQQMEVFTTAIAKVQFVQIYLEDSSLSLPSQGQDLDQAQAQAQLEPGIQETPRSNEQSSKAPAPKPQQDTATSSLSSRSSSSIKAKTAPKPSSPEPAPVPVPEETHKEPTKQSSSSRPPLEESSFSWMLGQEPQSKSSRASFLASSPFSDSRVRTPGLSRGRSAYLFGDEEQIIFSSQKSDKDAGSPSKPAARSSLDTHFPLRRLEDKE